MRISSQNSSNRHPCGLWHWRGQWGSTLREPTSGVSESLGPLSEMEMAGSRFGPTLNILRLGGGSPLPTKLHTTYYTGMRLAMASETMPCSGAVWVESLNVRRTHTLRTCSCHGPWSISALTKARIPSRLSRRLFGSRGRPCQYDWAFHGSNRTLCASLRSCTALRLGASATEVRGLEDLVRREIHGQLMISIQGRSRKLVWFTTRARLRSLPAGVQPTRYRQAQRRGLGQAGRL